MDPTKKYLDKAAQLKAALKAPAAFIIHSSSLYKHAAIVNCTLERLERLRGHCQSSKSVDQLGNCVERCPSNEEMIIFREIQGQHLFSECSCCIRKGERGSGSLFFVACSSYVFIWILRFRAIIQRHTC